MDLDSDLSTTSMVSSEGDTLTLENLENIISKIEIPINFLHKIIHNCTKEVIEKVFGKPIKDDVLILYGVPVITVPCWPEGMISMINEEGYIIQNFTVK